MKKDIVVGSHQPHFFPWLGYLDKMAKSDMFIINDIAQLETKSPMTRNRIIDERGTVRYLNIPIKKSGHTQVSNNQILLSDWNSSKERILGILINSYRKAPFFSEIIAIVRQLIENEYQFLYEIDLATIEMFRECFDINTPIIINSSLVVDSCESKSEAICKKVKAVGGNIYLSGLGGKKYMEEEVFAESGIKVIYQDFSYPVYSQYNSTEFIPNLSALDLLFNCGVEQSRSIFWKNVKRTRELIL